MRHPLLFEIKLSDKNEGCIKACRCINDTVQVIEEMKFSQGTIIISRSETGISVDIMQSGSSEAWVFEN